MYTVYGIYSIYVQYIYYGIIYFVHVYEYIENV